VAQQEEECTMEKQGCRGAHVHLAVANCVYNRGKLYEMEIRDKIGNTL